MELQKILDIFEEHGFNENNCSFFRQEDITDIANEIKAAINYTRCCESVKDKYTHTFEVDLNSVKRQEQYNKQIEQIHNAPCKTYIFDGEKYIELKP